MEDRIVTMLRIILANSVLPLLWLSIAGSPVYLAVDPHIDSIWHEQKAQGFALVLLFNHLGLFAASCAFIYREPRSRIETFLGIIGLLAFLGTTSWFFICLLLVGRIERDFLVTSVLLCPWICSVVMLGALWTYPKKETLTATQFATR